MKPKNPTCPDCGGPMESRINRQNQRRFWGCKNYPNCKGTRDTDGLSRSERNHDREDTEDRPAPRWRGFS